MTCYVSEWPSVGEVETESVPCGGLPCQRAQEIAPGSSGTPFGPNTRFVLVVSDAAVLINTGAAPTSTAFVYVPADTPMYFAVAPGDTLFTAAP